VEGLGTPTEHPAEGIGVPTYTPPALGRRVWVPQSKQRSAEPRQASPLGCVSPAHPLLRSPIQSRSLPLLLREVQPGPGAPSAEEEGTWPGSSSSVSHHGRGHPRDHCQITNKQLYFLLIPFPRWKLLTLGVLPVRLPKAVLRGHHPQNHRWGAHGWEKPPCAPKPVDPFPPRSHGEPVMPGGAGPRGAPAEDASVFARGRWRRAAPPRAFCTCWPGLGARRRPPP